MARTVRVSSSMALTAVAVGCVAGLAMWVSGVSPTGSTPIDALLLIVAGAGVVWAGASAPWWMLMTLSGMSTLLAVPWWARAVGTAAFVGAIAIALRHRSLVVERAVVVGASLVALAQAGDQWFFGATSLAGVGLAVATALFGLRRRSHTDRRRALWAVAAAGVVVVVGVGGLAFAAQSVEDELRAGNAAAREGLSLVGRGEFEGARDAFARAATQLKAADDELGRPWTQPARFVPVAAQHRAAGTALAAEAADAARVIEQQLTVVDLDALRLRNGRIDITAVEGLREPLAAVQGAVVELDEAISDVRSPWLVDQVSSRLADLEVDLGEQRKLGDRAVAALDVAPDILGANGERVYFVMFTTPAEVRGQGGFMGNWAELTADDGRIEMTRFGRSRELSQAAANTAVVSGPADWLGRYGPYGYTTGPDGVSVGTESWSNITMSPHFPSTARVVADLFPQSGGQQVDGVLSLDPYAIERLVGLVGPIEIDEAPRPLTGGNTADFLLREQYEITNDERVDLLETVAETTLERLLASAPPPLDLGRALSPMADERRLLAWSADPGEQAVIVDAGMDGALPVDEPGRREVAIALNNAAANKIDPYLWADYTVTEHDDGTAMLTAELLVDPPDGDVADAVVSNYIDLPWGHTRVYFSLFTDSALGEVTIDGEPAELYAKPEAGLAAYSTFLVLPQGQTVTLTAELNTSCTTCQVATIDQPMVNVPRWSFS